MTTIASPQHCLLNRSFRRRSKKTSTLRVTGLCVENSPGPVNSPHKGPVTRKCFHLMTSSWWVLACVMDYTHLFVGFWIRCILDDNWFTRWWCKHRMNLNYSLVSFWYAGFLSKILTIDNLIDNEDISSEKYMVNSRMKLWCLYMHISSYDKADNFIWKLLLYLTCLWVLTSYNFLFYSVFTLPLVKVKF